jgi:hypothetical protein
MKPVNVSVWGYINFVHFETLHSEMCDLLQTAYFEEIKSPKSDMSLESHGGMILTGETDKLGEKPIPVPLCSPQNPHD